MIGFRQTYANIDLDKLDHNVKVLKNKIDKDIIGVIKAYGYGHGDVETARILNKNGINFLAVSSLDEAIHLRENDIDSEILVLSHVDKHNLNICERFNISITVGSYEYLNNIGNFKIKVHIKVDTGMNRIGIKDLDEIKKAIVTLKEKGYLVEGIFTHFASADENDEYFEFQKANFIKIVEQIDHDFKYIHSANSASSLLGTGIGNMVRVGIALYGLKPYENCDLDLKQVMSLTTQIVLIKKVSKNTSIGYGHTYQTDHDCYIATIPIGYADGFLRANQNREVVIGNKRYPIVGRICMDQCMIEVDQPYEIGTEVAIFNDILTIDEMAKDLNTISYEIITNISDRVTRRYYQNNKLLKEINYRK